MTLVSRMTCTLISPGYRSFASIVVAIVRARVWVSKSVSVYGLTKTRISRPAAIAKALSTPAKSVAIASSSERRLI